MLHQKTLVINLFGRTVLGQVLPKSFSDFEKLIDNLNRKEKPHPVYRYLDEDDEAITFQTQEEYELIPESIGDCKVVNIIIDSKKYLEKQSRKKKRKQYQKNLENTFERLKHNFEVEPKSPVPKTMCPIKKGRWDEFWKCFQKEKMNKNPFKKYSEDFSNNEICLQSFLSNIIDGCCCAKSQSEMHDDTPHKKELTFQDKLVELKKVGYENNELNRELLLFFEGDLKKTWISLQKIYHIKYSKIKK